MLNYWYNNIKNLGGYYMVKKVAIITNGGDCPGLNAVIRAIVKTAETHGVECYRIYRRI